MWECLCSFDLAYALNLGARLLPNAYANALSVWHF